MSAPPASPPSKAPIPFAEFVALIAAMMATNALGIDTMLPALPEMARSLGLTQANQQQWIITIYTLSFGLSQIVYGPLADRYGRRPLLLGGLALFAVACVAASITNSFTTLIIARIVQGMAAAAIRVVAVTSIRDLYSGRRMAQVASFSFIIFMMVPILAPSLGQLIITFGSWRRIFDVLAILGIVLAIWYNVRLGETMNPAFRRAIDLRSIREAARIVVSDRASIGYTIGLTVSFGAILGFVTSAQQIFTTTFHAYESFPIFFGVAGLGMAMASFVNTRIVMRLGTRMVSHSAMMAYIAISLLHLIVATTVGDTLYTFLPFQFGMMFCAGMIGSNFGAMAMENMAEIAGSASSLQGAFSSAGGAVVAILIGQAFDGTVMPIVIGYFLCGFAMLGGALYAEHGRLFRPQHAAA